jgi:hypothetical protein
MANFLDERLAILTFVRSLVTEQALAHAVNDGPRGCYEVVTELDSLRDSFAIEHVGMGKARKRCPQDVTDEERWFLLPYLFGCRVDAGLCEQF